MKDLEKLSNMLKELDDLLVGCMKCGLCQGVCPVFAETRHEGDVTRGKLYLLEGLADRMITDVQGVKEGLDRCLLCGTCVANCPSGVSALEIFILARSILTEFVGLSVAKKAIFRGLVSRPKLFNGILDLSRRFQKLFITPANPKMGTYCSQALSSFIGDRHFTPLADRAFTHSVKKRRHTGSGMKVLLFPGCVIDKIYPRVAEAAVRVLEKNGCDVWVPEEQVCCGIPALASGERKTFETLYHRNLDLFAGINAEYLLTPCATCTSTIRKIWPMMERDMTLGRKKEVGDLSAVTMDISEFLVDVLDIPPALDSGVSAKRVTYHDPCHLGKSLGVKEQPRKILRQSGKVDLVEMKDADVCCGNGGSFNLQHYETSMAIGDHKYRNIMDSGADVVATSCPACMMQIADLLSRKQHAIEVKHVIEILDEKT